MSRIRNTKAFTLIELIVVVVIIGVLAAIAAIGYNKFVGDARAKAVLADGKQIATAINAEVANAGVALPVAAAAGVVTITDGDDVAPKTLAEVKVKDAQLSTDGKSVEVGAGDHQACVNIPQNSDETAAVTAGAC